MEVLTRFGVFLRPDPVTCAAVTAITGQLRARYGLVSAGAFPPQVTLAGSLPVAGDGADLLAAVDAAVRPLLTDPSAGQLPADVRGPDQWRGHVSLATHELATHLELLAAARAVEGSSSSSPRECAATRATTAAGMSPRS